MLFSLAIAGNYYAYDSIAPVADLLRRWACWSQDRIGLLNAVVSLPNIVVALAGGLLIDRQGVTRVLLGTAALCFIGGVLTAMGSAYPVMVAGRLFFGLGQETLLIALLGGLARWFPADQMAFAMASFFSLARVGSSLADLSPVWAHGLYAWGWQAPLWLAAALTGVSLLAVCAYAWLDRRAMAVAYPGGNVPHGTVRDAWVGLKEFDLSFWYILALNVLFASAVFPFRSTFAIAYFQDARGLTLADAGRINSLVFLAAIFVTPLCGMVADRFGHRTLLMAFGAGLMPLAFLILGITGWSPWISAVLMGVSFSIVPAVIWPSTVRLVDRRVLGTALGLVNVLQNAGLTLANLLIGRINTAWGAGPDNPSGYDGMLAFLGLVSFLGFLSAALLWQRERGPNGHGLALPGAASHGQE